MALIQEILSLKEFLRLILMIVQGICIFKYLKQGFMLFKQNIASLIAGDFSLKKQSCEHSSYFSRKDIDVCNIKINLQKTSFEIHNQLRAFILKNISNSKNFLTMAIAMMSENPAVIFVSTKINKIDITQIQMI